MPEQEKKPDPSRVSGFDFMSGDVRMVWDRPPTCPYCGDVLELKILRPSWFPYVHVDFKMVCPTCEREYLFGIPCNTYAGLSLQIWDSNKLGILKQALELGSRTCYWEHHGEMLLTKVWGDWVPRPGDTIRVQWKCPECFVVRQETFKREPPHLEENVKFTDSAQAVLLKRLQRLGYIE